MIYATGDTHGNFQRFAPEHFPEQAGTAAQPHQQIQRVQAGPETLQRPRKDSKQGKEFL